jgi:hypothetical protein
MSKAGRRRSGSTSFSCDVAVAPQMEAGGEEEGGISIIISPLSTNSTNSLVRQCRPTQMSLSLSRFSFWLLLLLLLVLPLLSAANIRRD